MFKRLSFLSRLWYNWKVLQLPWRKKFLRGVDLDGNTYWEFRDLREASAPSAPVRWRRIVQYPRGTHPGAVRVPPVWHQWLRHVRAEPPSVAEQQQEVARKVRMRALAAAADARWADARRVDEGEAVAAAPALPEAASTPAPRARVVVQAVAAEASTATTAAPPPPPPPSQKPDPWAEAQKGLPAQAWQPKAWGPSSPRKR